MKRMFVWTKRWANLYWISVMLQIDVKTMLDIIKYQWHIFVWPSYFYFYLLFTVAIFISIFSHKWTRLVWHKIEDYFSITFSSDIIRLEIWVCGSIRNIYTAYDLFCACLNCIWIFFIKKTGFNRITNIYWYTNRIEFYFSLYWSYNNQIVQNDLKSC